MWMLKISIWHIVHINAISWFWCLSWVFWSAVIWEQGQHLYSLWFHAWIFWRHARKYDKRTYSCCSLIMLRFYWLSNRGTTLGINVCLSQPAVPGVLEQVLFFHWADLKVTVSESRSSDFILWQFLSFLMGDIRENVSPFAPCNTKSDQNSCTIMSVEM